MFTGIVEAIGEIEQLSGDRMVLICPLDGIVPGDSVAVDGCCLTVVEAGSGTVGVQLLEETRKKTTLREALRGRRVNLERALAAAGRFGGHFVTGHVDGVGTIASRRRIDSDDVVEVRGPASIMAYIVPKGCIAVDGVSLTVVDAGRETFTFHVIEHTRTHTTLGGKHAGDRVNLEADVLAKYVEKFVARQSTGLTEEKLRSSGMLD